MCNASNWVPSANDFIYTLVDESISFCFQLIRVALITPGMVHATRGREKMCKRRNDITTLASYIRKFYLGTDFT